MDRTVEYEEILLAQILIDNNIWWKLTVDEYHFSKQKTRQIYKALEKGFSDGFEMNLLTTYENDTMIDANYLASMTSKISSSANWIFYQNKIKKALKKRQVNVLSLNLQDWVKKHDPEKCIENIEKVLSQIANNNKAQQIQSLTQLVPGFIDVIEKRYNNQGEMPGYRTGINYLDDHILGFQKKRLYCIGARPSQGKSALALNMAAHIAVQQEVPAGFISLESDSAEIMLRLFAAEGSINSEHLATGILKTNAFNKLIDIGNKFHGKPLYFYRSTNRKWSEISAILRRMVDKYKAKIIFIDYLQLIEYGTIHDTRHERIRYISTELKNLAESLNIPIVELVQLRRDSEGRRPTLADFSDSSQIEKDADVAILIYHQQKEETVESWLLIEKNRDGKTGAVKVHFQKEYIKFYQAIKGYSK